MGKAVKTIALVALGAVVLVATGGAAAIFSATALAAGATVGTGAAVLAGTAAVLGAAAVIGGALSAAIDWAMPDLPSTNTETNFRLNKTLNPEESRKMIFGETAASSDIRYWEAYGTDNKQYDEVIAVATHEIESFGNFYFETDLLSFDGSGDNTDQYGANLNKKDRTVGVTGTSLSAGAGSKWTANSSMTGCAFYVLRFLYDQELFPRGFPTRITQVVKGAKVYDPRLDSTRGGAGLHRADDQTTWEYNDGVDDIGKNPALQILWYLLGWRINSVLVAGMGVDPDDIDFPSFITAANSCDTESYEGHCALSTGDSHERNLSLLRSSCGGTLIDTGGRYSFHPAIDDTGVIAATFDDSDIVGAYNWVPKAKMRSQFNEVAGSFIDVTAFYQSAAYPKVEDAAYVSADGFTKRRTIDFQTIQDDEQAQKLARLFLNRTRFQGVFQAPFSYKAMLVKNWDIVQLSFTPFGWTNELFRVVQQSITTDGQILLTLRQESSAIYAGGTINPALPSNTGSAWDASAKIDVAGLSAIAITETGTVGTVSDGIKISWTAPSSIVSFTEVQYKINADSDWIAAAILTQGETDTKIVPAESGTLYDTRARHISISNVVGDWFTDPVTTGTNRDSSPGATAGAQLGVDVTDSGDNVVSDADALNVQQEWDDVQDANNTRPEDLATMSGSEGFVTDPNFAKTDAIGGLFGGSKFWNKGTHGTIAIDDTGGEHGQPNMKMTGDAGSWDVTLEAQPRIPAKVGDRIGVRIRFYAEAGVTGSEFNVRLSQYDAISGSFLGSVTILSGSTSGYATGSWGTLEASGVLDQADVEYASVYVNLTSSVGATDDVWVDLFQAWKLPDLMDNTIQEWDDVQDANNTRPDDLAFSNIDGSNTIVDPFFEDATKWEMAYGFSIATPPPAGSGFDTDYAQVLELDLSVAPTSFDSARTVIGGAFAGGYKVPAKKDDIFYILMQVSTDGTGSGEGDSLGMVLESYNGNDVVQTYDNIKWQMSEMKATGTPQWVYGAVRITDTNTVYMVPRFEGNNGKVSTTKNWWCGYIYVGKENPLASIRPNQIIQDPGFDLQYNYGGVPYVTQDSFWWETNDKDYGYFEGSNGENGTPNLKMIEGKAGALAISTSDQHPVIDNFKVKFGDIITVRVRLKFSAGFNTTLDTDFRVEIVELDKDLGNLSSWPDFFDMGDVSALDTWLTIEGTVTPLDTECEFFQISFYLGTGVGTGDSVVIDSVQVQIQPKITSNDYQEWDDVNDANSTRPEDNADVTSANTAANIAGQGDLATKSSVDLATAEVANKTADNIAETVSLKWAAESGADVTATNTAADIAGQGDLATLSSVGNSKIDDVSVSKLIVGNLSVAFTIIAGGEIVLSSAGHIRGGQTAYETGTGWWLGYDSGDYKFSIGDADNFMKFDGTDLILSSTNNFARKSTNVKADAVQYGMTGGTTEVSNNGVPDNWKQAKEFHLIRGGNFRVEVEAKCNLAGPYDQQDPSVRCVQGTTVVSTANATYSTTGYVKASLDCVDCDPDQTLIVEIQPGIHLSIGRIITMRQMWLWSDTPHEVAVMEDVGNFPTFDGGPL